MQVAFEHRNKKLSSLSTYILKFNMVQNIKSPEAKARSASQVVLLMHQAVFPYLYPRRSL